MWRRKIATAFASLALVLAVTGCSGDSRSGGGDDGTLTFGTLAAPSSLNPAKSFGHMVVGLAYEGILNLDPDGTPVAGLATEWGYRDDANKVFAFTLREDAKFSDGTPVDAAAVKAWFEHMQTSGGASRSNLGAMTVATEGDYTVVMTFAESDPDVARVLATGSSTWGSVASATVLAENPDSLETQTVGAGPYVLDPEQTSTGDTYTYVPNEYYFDPEAIHYEEIVVKIMPNHTSRMQAFQSGQIDAMDGESSLNEQASGLDGVELFPTRTAAQSFVVADASGAVPALASLEVRQALNHAIDRDSIAKAVYGETAESLDQMPNADAFSDETSYDYDPEKARHLLADAGYPDGFTLDVVTQDYVGSAWVTLSQAVFQQWAEIGVDVKVTASTSLPDYYTNAAGSVLTHTAPQFERTLLQNYRTYLRPGGFFHTGDWVDEELEALYQQGIAAEDNTEIVTEMAELITERAYFVPVSVISGGYYVKDSIDDVEITDERYLPALKEWKPAS